MMSIPYSSEPRPDTGLYNAKLGMWLFLATEVMFFGALYSSCVFLRTANAQWPEGASLLPVGWSFVSLVALAGAAACSAQAWAVLRVDEGERPWPWLGGVLLCGLLALTASVAEYRIVVSGGVTAATSNFYGLYFLLTTLQRLHVLAAVLLSGLALVRGQRSLLRDATAYMNRLECLGLFWQFLLLLWVTFMLVFYLI